MNKDMISEQLFNQIKLVHKFLVKASAIEPDGIDLSSMPTEKLEEQVEDALPDEETLGYFMNQLPDFLCASDLKIVDGDSETIAFTNNKNIYDNDPLAYWQLAKRIAKMIKLGRSGIARLNERNLHLQDEISNLRDKMDVIA